MTTSTKTKIKLVVAAILSMATLSPLFAALSADTSEDFTANAGAVLFYLIIIIPLLISAYRANKNQTQTESHIVK